MSQKAVIAVLASIAGVAAVTVAVFLSNEYGGKTYKGKRVAEWRRMAADGDLDTRLAAYMALDSMGEGAFLKARFATETHTDSKLIAAKWAAIDDSMVPRVVAYLEKLLSSPEGYMCLKRDALHDTAQTLAIKGKAGSLIPIVEKMRTSAFDREDAQRLLDKLNAPPVSSPPPIRP